jgi:predicted amidophosphoribosyltransferase
MQPVCPACGSAIQAGALECSTCRAALAIPCPFCGAGISLHAETCPTCLARIA